MVFKQCKVVSCTQAFPLSEMMNVLFLRQLVHAYIHTKHYRESQGLSNTQNWGWIGVLRMGGQLLIH